LTDFSCKPPPTWPKGGWSQLTFNECTRPLKHTASVVETSSKREARSILPQDKCRAGAKRGRTAINHPKIPSPAPNHNKSVTPVSEANNVSALRSIVQGSLNDTYLGWRPPPKKPSTRCSPGGTEQTHTHIFVCHHGTMMRLCLCAACHERRGNGNSAPQIKC